MACLQLSLFVPVKVMTIAILMSVLVLLSIKTGFAIKQTGICRPFCTGMTCITLNHDRVDLKRAEEACRDRNGKLLTFESETDENILDSLSQELNGNFWIGLRLPPGTCSNSSAPLRGYEWTTGSIHQSFIPSFSVWKDSVEVCSPRCVSLSGDRKWTERLCSDKTDGYLCKTSHKDACQAQELSDPNVFQSSKGCLDAPCEHTCIAVKGGYKCSCFRGYIPDTKDPRQCKMHCTQQLCPVICESGSACYCPDGFLKTENICLDMDECLIGKCDQKCENTFGSFVCSCQEGFVLKDQVKCIKAEQREHFVITTPITIGSVKPASNNNTTKSSSAPTAGFLLIWIFIALAVVVFIFVIRFYVVKHQKRREQNSNQQSSVPVDNTEC